MNFQKLKGRVAEELSLTYKDFLRVIFSRKFIRNRKLYTAIVIAPPIFWGLAFDEKEFFDVKIQRDQIRYFDIEERIQQELPMDKKTWKYLVNHDVRNFPR